MDKYDSLKIENQICFPLYACSKEVIRLYKPFLDMLDLTYTQYITMMVLWEYRELNVKELGEKIYLDSGTLTPLLKKLESKGYIKRSRSKEDERNLLISITDEGMSLREEALQVPEKMAGCVKLDMESAKNLYDILYKLLNNFKGN
ncbi:MAG: MarR family transcriptional regulator [Acholeplasmatales bacterium]|nr:MarR family transcriptional regulator [Acholeplasmatales bacterium]